MYSFSFLLSLGANPRLLIVVVFQVNERLVTNPKLVSERPDAEGYLAVILPPIKNGDAPLRRLINAQQYWSQER